MKAEKKKKNKPILNQSVAEHSIHKKHSCASLFSPCSLFFLRLLTVTLIKLFSLSRLLPLVSLLLLIDEKKNKKKKREFQMKSQSLLLLWLLPFLSVCYSQMKFKS